jgi:signal transduction histidine kinase
VTRGRRALAWTMFAAALCLVTAALTLFALSSDSPSNTYGFRGGIPLVTVAVATTGAVIALRRPEHPIGWIFLAVGLLSGVQSAAQEYAVYAVHERGGEIPGGVVADWIDSWIWVPITGTIAIPVFLLFPDGRLPSPRWRPVLVAGIAGIVVWTVTFAVYPEETAALGTVNPFAAESLEPVLNVLLGVGGLLFMGSMLSAAISLVLRYRRASEEARHQLKWFAASAAFVGLAFTLNGFSSTSRVVSTLVVISFATVPMATAVAVLKYRLYEIDVVINKAVVYGALAAFITGVYIAIVVGFGSLLGGGGDEPDVGLSIAATALLAVAFQPVRLRVQRLANRLVYGERATPYEVLADFSHRMAGALSVEAVLPRMARAAAEGVGGAGGRIRLYLPGGSERTVVWPPDADPGPPTRVIPVAHRGERVGEIGVTKPPGEPLTPAEERLLTDLAAQAGLALHNVRLAVELEARLDEISRAARELRASRQRLVSAQDAERRRLEREIHDGAERQLAAMQVRIGKAEELLGREPAVAADLLETVAADAGTALEGLRDLARGVFPPLLADRGLVAALGAQVRKAAFPARVEAGPDVAEARFDPRAEAAVYFCCLEAMTNAARHASGSPVTVQLAAGDGWVSFRVSDEGPGFDAVGGPGWSGLQRMRDRVEALRGTLDVRSAPGQGTTVEGRVPAEALQSIA